MSLTSPREAQRQPSDPGHGTGAERRGYRGSTLSRLCRWEKSLYSFFVKLDGCHANSRTSDQLLQELDASLRELNVEYAQKRRVAAPCRTGYCA